MDDAERKRVRGFYRARIAAIHAMFEGHATVQRERLEAPDCTLPLKKRTAMLKKLEKDEASMAKAFRRALKELDK
jgi:hypothetical protein